MDVPTGERVSLVLTGRMPPAVVLGDFVRFLGTTCVVRLGDDAPDLAPDETLVLEFADPKHALIQGQVDAVEGCEIRLTIERFKPRDQREFPRVEGGLEVEYRLAPAEEALLDAWMDEGAAPPDGSPWRRPNPFMDLSASGLGFEDEDPPADGDRLLVSFSLPGQGIPWRAVGRVVRVIEGEGQAPRVAVELTRLGDEARAALLEKTIELLELPGELDTEGASDV